MDKSAIHHPEPEGARPRLLPVFLPHAGCPAACGTTGRERCIFCDQQAQSGQAERSLEAHLAALRGELAVLERRGAAGIELGFYGGAFTALPHGWPERFLELAAEYGARGVVSGARCSTRPDACDPALLARLRDRGLLMVELGVQSFSDAALAACRRGHDAAQARQGCAAVRAVGLRLGVHLMPGLPGGSLHSLLADASECAAQGAESVRLHPCLVLARTPLARLWQDGGYRPWPLEKALAACGLTVLRLWRAGVRVARLGLASEASLLGAVLDGPWHPAFGQRARSRALHLALVQAWETAGRPRGDLLVPARHLPDVIGWRREMVRRYARLGLTPKKHDATFFLLPGSGAGKLLGGLKTATTSGPP